MKKQILTSELEKRKKPKFQINSITYKNNKINVYPVKDKTGKVKTTKNHEFYSLTDNGLGYTISDRLKKGDYLFYKGSSIKLKDIDYINLVPDVTDHVGLILDFDL